MDLFNKKLDAKNKTENKQTKQTTQDAPLTGH